MQALLKLKRNKGATKSKKRVGRGNSSGIGSTCGRGENGQKSRTGGKLRLGFTGGDTPLIKKLPKLKGFKNPNKVKFQTVNLDKLNNLEDNSEVTAESLFNAKLISSKSKPVKILGNGEISKKLNLKISYISSSAKQKIEKAGGSVEIIKKEEPKAKSEKSKA